MQRPFTGSRWTSLLALLLLVFASLATYGSAQAELPSEWRDLVVEVPGTDGPNGPRYQLLTSEFTLEASDETREDGVELNWSSPPGAWVRFEVYRDDDLLTWLSAEDSSYVDTTQRPLRTSEYRVDMIDLESEFVLSLASDLGTTGLFQPEDVNATENDLGGVQVVWDDRSMIESGYIVRRDGAVLDSLDANTTAYFDSSAVPLTTYEYCAQAYITDGDLYASIGSASDSQANYVVADGDIAYVTTTLGNEMHAYDVSDPANPQQLGTLALGGTPSGRLDVFFGYGRAFVPVGTAGIDYVDFTDPESPFSYGVGDTPGQANAMVRNPEEPDGWVADGSAGIAFMGLDSGVPGFNFSFAISGTANDITRDDNFILYVAAGSAGLVVVDSDGPTLLDEIQTPGDATSLVIDGSHAYIADGSGGLRIIDISDPSDLADVGNLTAGQLGGNPTHVEKNGTRVYLSTSNGVIIADVSDPRHPMLVNDISSVGNAKWVNIGRDLAYVADSSAGLEIFQTPIDAASDVDCDNGVVPTLDVPDGIVASFGQYDDRVVITWNDNTDGETGYRVTRDGTPLGDLPVDTTSFEDTNAGALGSEYEYCVYVLDPGANALLGGCAQGIGGPGTLLPPTSLASSGGYGPADPPARDDLILLTWDDAPGEDGYEIWREIPEISPPELVATLPAGTTMYEDTSGEIGELYGYHLLAVADAGGSSISLSGEGRQIAVVPPDNVQATDGDFETHVDITWESTSTTVVLFEIKRDEIPFKTVTGTARATQDFDGIPGTDHIYRVVAQTASGDEFGVADSGRRDLLPPTDVQAEDGIAEDRVLVNWTDNSLAETGYYIYRQEDDTPGTLARIDSLNANRTAYIDYGAVPGQLYDYFITAHDALGESDITAGGATDEGIRHLNPPTNLTASLGTFEDQVVLEWEDNSGIELGYRVFRNGSPIGGNLSPNTITFTDTGMGFATTHDYEVLVYDALGTSEAAATQGYTAILPPGSVNASDSYPTEVVITWTDESVIETGYDVRRNGISIGSAGQNETQFIDGSPLATTAEYCVLSTRPGSVFSEPACDDGTATTVSDPSHNAYNRVDSFEASGGLSNRIRVQWENAMANDEHELYRDGELIATLEGTDTSYDDLDALPGRAHRYFLRSPGGGYVNGTSDVGWRPADGAVSGSITTRAGAPVSDVTVSLEPSPNQALLFDGDEGHVLVEGLLPHTGVPHLAHTIEFWAKMEDQESASTPYTVFGYSAMAWDQDLELRLVDQSNGNLHVRLYIRDQVTSADVSPGVVDPFDGEWHHFASSWQGSDDTWLFYIDGVLRFTRTTPNTSVSPSDSGILELGRSQNNGGEAPFLGLLDEVRFWDDVRDSTEIRTERFTQLTDEDDLRAYWSMDAGAGVGLADMTGNAKDGVLTGGVYWADNPSPISTFTATDVEGNYSLTGVHYNGARTFRVIPSADGRAFEPQFKTITIDEQSPVQNEVAFSDISAYSLSGLVSLEGTTCTEDGVEIYIDDEFAGATRVDGTFTVSAQPGSHVIEVRADGRTYSPARREIQVDADMAGLDFVNTTTNDLTLTIGGGCGFPIGDVTVLIATENGCKEVTVVGGDASPQLERLPAQRYLASVTQVENAPYPLSNAEILTYFTNQGAQEIDLSTGDVEFELTYKAPVTMIVNGFPAATCGQFIDPETNLLSPGAPVIAQLEAVPLTIDVYENYGNGNFCPADSGTVTIFDEIMDVSDSPTELQIVDGQVQYTTTGNTPNIYPGRQDPEGNDRSYQKPITIVAQVEGQDANSQIHWALVTGDKPRSGTFVSATSEEIPLMILRDPPGDGSTATLERGTTYNFELRDLFQVTESTGVEVGIEAGFQFSVGTLFWSTDAEAEIETTAGFEVGVSATQEGTVAISVTTTEELSTSDEEVFVGPDADLIMGIALNLLFAKTDQIGVDSGQEPCPVLKSESVRFGGDGEDPFETIYLYTTSHIGGSVIPTLEELAVLSPADSLQLLAAAQNWEEHLALNDSLRVEALANTEVNRSFSAGAELSYSIERTRSEEVSWDVAVTSTLEASTQVGFEISGTGASATFSTSLEFEVSFGGTEGSETFMTTGYTLADDDPGDFFSVDIGTDPMYGTPVFQTVSGRSACPLEANTQERDQVTISVLPDLLSEVPLTEPAEFQLTITNDSQSEEAREYQVRAVQTSNPYGAQMKINGIPLQGGISFFLDPGPQLATLTVEPGPSRFFYNDLKVQVVAPCEYEIWEAGGALAVSDTTSFSVSFDSPCSDVTLVKPWQGWTHGALESASTNDSIYVSINQFELAISETDSIIDVGAQYRAVGDDLWRDIVRVPRADVLVYPSGHAQVGEVIDITDYWHVTPINIVDGQYDIRAFARCFEGLVSSEVVRGRIDREEPEVLATQPADGVLALGDAISITFNEEIDCHSVSDQTVSLGFIEAGGDTTTVAISTVCNGSTVVITPTAPSLDLLEGKTLVATAQGIEDLVGNSLAGAEIWDFTVARTVFAWGAGSVYKEAAFRAPGTLTATLVNGGAIDATYVISDLAPWLSASPNSGAIVAGQSEHIQLTIDPGLPIGTHTDTLFASVPDSTSPSLQAELEVRVDIACQPPTWSVDPAGYEHTMTAVIRPSIQSTVSQDPNDIVAAFVGNDVRGVASPQNVSGLGWLVFMNIYSNRSVGENVRFQIFDDSDCRLYGAADNFLRFERDRRQGTPENPIALEAQDAIPGSLQVLDMDAGWTYFSVNLVDSQDMSVLSILGDLTPEVGDVIKSQATFSEFLYDTSGSNQSNNSGWFGTLTEINPRESYALSLDQAGTLFHQGDAVTPNIEIQLIDEWNWVGYPPAAGQDVNDALLGLNPTNGDVIKGQQGFAQYVATSDTWIGDLSTLEPGEGYRLYVDNATTAGPLAYTVPAPLPGAAARGTSAASAAVAASTSTASETDPTPGEPEAVGRGEWNDRKPARDRQPTSDGARAGSVKGAVRSLSPTTEGEGANRPDWSLQVGRQHNMTVVGKLELDGVGIDSDQALIGAFVGDELRGVGTVQYVDPINEHVTFLMIHSNEASGETVRFRVYDPGTDAVAEVVEEIQFITDSSGGTLSEPFVFHAMSQQGPNGAPLPAAFALQPMLPNPVRSTTNGTIRWAVPTQEHVSIRVFNVQGRVVRTLVDDVLAPGWYTADLATDGLASGTYFYRIQAGRFTKAQKFVLLK